MKTAKLVVGILLIFIVGVLTGIVLTQHHYQNRFERFISMGRGNPQQHLMRRLEKELNLSEPQRLAISQLLQQSHEKIVKLRQSHKPEVKEIFEESIALIRKELDTDQQKKLDKILQRVHRRGPAVFPARRFGPPAGKPLR